MNFQENLFLVAFQSFDNSCTDASTNVVELYNLSVFAVYV